VEITRDKRKGKENLFRRGVFSQFPGSGKENLKKRRGIRDSSRDHPTKKAAQNLIAWLYVQHGAMWKPGEEKKCSQKKRGNGGRKFAGTSLDRGEEK